MHEYTALYICGNNCCYIFWFIVTILIEYIQDGQFGDYVTLCNDYYKVIHASITTCVLQKINKHLPHVIEIHNFLLKASPKPITPRFREPPFHHLIL